MKHLYITLFFSTLLFSNEAEILTSTKKEIIQLKKEQIKEKEQINKYNWVSDITANASVLKDKEDIQSQDYSLSFSQDIYRFGGISSQIEYSKHLKNYEALSLDISTKEDVSTIYTLLVDIKLNDISLKKNILNQANTYIDLIQKKSEYKAGELGISDLNEVIMTKNSLKETEKTLELTLKKNINTLKQYTNKNYSSIPLYKLKLMSKKVFLEKASAVKSAFYDTKVNKSSLDIKKSDYLPKLSLTGKYGYKNGDNIDGDDYYNYGLAVFMPFSYTSKNDIQQSKLEYLISKKKLQKQKDDISLTYDEVLLSLKNYEQKIILALDDIKLYEELLISNKEEYEAGYKTIDDIETLENSKKIRSLDVESYKLGVQKELIGVYAKIL